MADPMTMAVSVAFTHSPAEADPGFVSARVDFQSMSFKNGYAASESFLAASPISSAKAGVAPSIATAAGAAAALAWKPLPRGAGTKAGLCDAKYASAPSTDMAGTMILPERAMIVGCKWDP